VRWGFRVSVPDVMLSEVKRFAVCEPFRMVEESLHSWTIFDSTEVSCALDVGNNCLTTRCKARLILGFFVLLQLGNHAEIFESRDIPLHLPTSGQLA